MTDAWYYTEGDKQVGPVTLADLTKILAQLPDGRDVLVWGAGLSAWEKAGKVPELAAPATAAPQVITVSMMTGAPPVPPKKKELVGFGGWLVLVLIGQILGPLRQLRA